MAFDLIWFRKVASAGGTVGLLVAGTGILRERRVLLACCCNLPFGSLFFMAKFLNAL